MRQLGHLEADVMAVLWRNATPLTTRAVLEELQKDRPIAYTTVMTVLDNLHGKEMLVREKHGRAYSYAAAQTREQYTARLMEQVLATSADSAATLLHFVEQIPPEEVKQLRQALGGHPGKQAKP